VTGLLGYGAAWLQARTHVRQIEAENDRLRLQYTQEHLRYRRDAYHAFLSAMEEFEGLAQEGREAMSGVVAADPEVYYKKFVEWRQRKGDLYSGVRLFGTPQVIGTIEAFNAAFLAYGQASREKRDADQLLELELTWRGALDSVLHAMREDVREGQFGE
jgi:hypothetical protein